MRRAGPVEMRGDGADRWWLVDACAERADPVRTSRPLGAKTGQLGAAGAKVEGNPAVDSARRRLVGRLEPPDGPPGANLIHSPRSHTSASSATDGWKGRSRSARSGPRGRRRKPSMIKVAPAQNNRNATILREVHRLRRYPCQSPRGDRRGQASTVTS
jgi:hypothetical protein